MGILLVPTGIDEHSVVILEPGKTLDHLDFYAFVGIERHLAALFQDMTTVVLQFLPVDLRLGGPFDSHQAIMGTIPNPIGGSPPGFGRNTSAPQTLSTGERRIVDHGDLESMLHQIPRAVFTTRTTTDHDHVIIVIALGQLKVEAGWFGCGSYSGGGGIQPDRSFDQFLEGIEELGGISAVHNAMVSCYGYRHPLRADGGDGKNRRGTGRRNSIKMTDPHHTHVGDGKGGVGIFFRLEAPCPGPIHQVFPVGNQIAEITIQHIAQHGNHQAHAFRFHCQTDINLLAFQDTIFMLVHRVDNRVFLNRQGRRLCQGHCEGIAFGLGGIFQCSWINVDSHAEQWHGEGVLHVVCHGLFHCRHRTANTRNLIDASGRGLDFGIQDVGGHNDAVRPGTGNIVQVDTMGTGQLARVGCRHAATGTRRRGCPRRHSGNAGFGLGSAMRFGFDGLGSSRCRGSSAGSLLGVDDTV